MNTLHLDDAFTYTEIEWAPFAGGELEAPRPRALCNSCRNRRAAGAAPEARPALCFQCYRSELERNRKIRAAAELDTATEARFQAALPFEAVNQPRLARLKAEREEARARAQKGAGLYIERRHRAQIEARHALARILQGLKQRQLVTPHAHGLTTTPGVAGSQPRAAGLQLPEAWLPFVVAQ